MQDDTPIYEILFEMEINLSDRFNGMTPISLRKEKAREVFLLINRYSKYSKRLKKKSKANTLNGKKIIRRPASDNWF